MCVSYIYTRTVHSPFRSPYPRPLRGAASDKQSCIPVASQPSASSSLSSPSCTHQPAHQHPHPLRASTPEACVHQLSPRTAPHHPPPPRGPRPPANQPPRLTAHLHGPLAPPDTSPSKHARRGGDPKQPFRKRASLLRRPRQPGRLPLPVRVRDRPLEPPLRGGRHAAGRRVLRSLVSLLDARAGAGPLAVGTAAGWV